MAIKTYTLTFGGSSENVATNLGLVPATDPPCVQIVFEADIGNGAACYVADDATTASSTAFGFSFPATPAQTTRMVLGGQGDCCMKLKQFNVIGTTGQKLHITCVLY